MFRYWDVEYTSCEGNYRHTVVRAPDEWDKLDVETAVMRGASLGDDPAEIIAITETSSYNYKFGEDYA
jgi:hypothetical protein